MFQKFVTLIFAVGLAVAPAAVSAQDQNNRVAGGNETKEKKQKPQKQEKIDPKNLTAEQLAEVALVAYGGPFGRANLNAIRKTEIERGEITRFAPDGETVTGKSTYERRVVRGESLDKDRIRLDHKLTEAQYALIYDNNKTFGIINNAVFVPREEADRSFQAQIFHGLDALLRYKENGSTLKLGDKDKQFGVELYHLDVTDKMGRTTRFNISSKLYRVLSLEYSMPMTASAAPTKFVRKFYDYRNVQGTSVPWRSVLFVDGKPVEESNVQTVSYGSRIDETQFQVE